MKLRELLEGPITRRDVTQRSAARAANNRRFGGFDFAGARPRGCLLQAPAEVEFTSVCFRAVVFFYSGVSWEEWTGCTVGLFESGIHGELDVERQVSFFYWLENVCIAFIASFEGIYSIREMNIKLLGYSNFSARLFFFLFLRVRKMYRINCKKCYAAFIIYQNNVIHSTVPSSFS